MLKSASKKRAKRHASLDIVRLILSIFDFHESRNARYGVDFDNHFHFVVIGIRLLVALEGEVIGIITLLYIMRDVVEFRVDVVHLKSRSQRR